jgi:hypothetical protein
MLHSIYLYIISNNAGRLNAVKNLIPANGSAGIWADGYVLRREKDDMGINNVLIVNIDFHDEIDMTGLWNRIKGIDGVIRGCLDGSYMLKYENNHKWNKGNPDNIKACRVILREAA